jgi:hypothetical protein
MNPQQICVSFNLIPYTGTCKRKVSLQFLIKHRASDKFVMTVVREHFERMNPEPLLKCYIVPRKRKERCRQTKEEMELKFGQWFHYIDPECT